MNNLQIDFSGANFTYIESKINRFLSSGTIIVENIRICNNMGRFTVTLTYSQGIFGAASKMKLFMARNPRLLEIRFTEWYKENSNAKVIYSGNNNILHCGYVVYV